MSYVRAGQFVVEVWSTGWPVSASITAGDGSIPWMGRLSYEELCDLQHVVQRALAEMRPGYEKGGGGTLRPQG